MKGISNKHIFMCIEGDNFIQLFVDALVSKTNEELASDIILADQISRHIYRNKPLKKELFTKWAYLKAKKFVANIRVSF